MKPSSRYTPGKWTSGDHAALFIETPQGTWKAMAHKDDSSWSVRGPDPDDPLHYAGGEVSTADPDVKRSGAEGRYAAAKIRARAYIKQHASSAKAHAAKKSPATIDREIQEALVAKRIKEIDQEMRAIEETHGRHWMSYPPDVAKRHRALFDETAQLQNPHLELRDGYWRARKP